MLILVEDDGFVNLHLIPEGMEVNPEDYIDSYIRGAGIQARTEQPSFAIFQWIDGNKIPSGYINGVDDPLLAAIYFWRNKLCLLLPFISYLFLVRNVSHWL